MAYKLLKPARARGRKITGVEFVALVREGATFIDGKPQERSDTQAGTFDAEEDAVAA